MEPDRRVREAIGVVFSRFAEMQSIRQVFLSLRADRLELPYIDRKDTEQTRLMWKRPVYSTVNNLPALCSSCHLWTVTPEVLVAYPPCRS